MNAATMPCRTVSASELAQLEDEVSRLQKTDDVMSLAVTLATIAATCEQLHDSVSQCGDRVRYLEKMRAARRQLRHLSVAQASVSNSQNTRSVAPYYDILRWGQSLTHSHPDVAVQLFATAYVLRPNSATPRVWLELMGVRSLPVR